MGVIFVVAALVSAFAVFLAVAAWARPVARREMSLAQLVVMTLFRRAQRAMYLAYAADRALVAYREARREDKTMPASLWGQA